MAARGVKLLALLLLLAACVSAARVRDSNRAVTRVDADAEAFANSPTDPDVVKPNPAANKRETPAPINDNADASNGGAVNQKIGKKSHVTVIANTNKLFQIETPDGRTIDQYRDGGETVNGQASAAADPAMDASTMQDLNERREKRERRDKDFQDKMKQEGGGADGQNGNNGGNAGFDLSNMCALAKDRCPENWEDKGTAGIMLSDDKYDQVNPFAAQGDGANPDVGYKWTHPKLCCARNDKATLSDLYVLSRSCPNGNMDLIGGVTYLTSRYSRNPFQKEAGHDYNKFWRWIHPYVCRLDNGNDDLKSKHRSCLLAKQCGDSMRDFGFTGMIVKLSDVDKQPFQASEEQEFQEYKGWRWVHPKLCCNPNGE